MAEAQESLIEKWWFEDQKLNSNLQDWLCIQQLKVCCPNHHYGPDCRPCPGLIESSECSGSGKCKVAFKSDFV